MRAGHHAARGERRIEHVFEVILLAELLARERRAFAERPQLRRRDLAVHRRHAAVGAREQMARGDELQRLLDHFGNFLRRLHAVACHVDHADEHVLALEQLHQLDRHARVDALERDLLDPAFRQRGEDLLVLAPGFAERLLPVEVGLDAVAVADVHAGRALQPGDGAVQGVDAPALDVVHVDVEGRLVELDHVDAVLLQRARLLVEQLGERHGQLHLVAVVLVGERVDDGHRPRHGDLDLLLRVRAQDAGFGLVHAPLELQRAGHHRHHRVVAVVADAHLHLALEVDALDVLEEAVDEVLARLLAVGDDVQAGVFLLLQP